MASNAPAPLRIPVSPTPITARSEPDNGGPNSLYSICALGTDCNDCGPR